MRVQRDDTSDRRPPTGWAIRRRYASESIFARLQTPTRRRGGSWGWSLLPRRARGVLRVQPDGHRITVRPVDHPPRGSVTAATPRIPS